jgi:hypothetical protein
MIIVTYLILEMIQWTIKTYWLYWHIFVNEWRKWLLCPCSLLTESDWSEGEIRTLAIIRLISSNVVKWSSNLKHSATHRARRKFKALSCFLVPVEKRVAPLVALLALLLAPPPPPVILCGLPLVGQIRALQGAYFFARNLSAFHPRRIINSQKICHDGLQKEKGAGA